MNQPFYSYTKTGGFPSENPSCVMMDSKNRIWISTDSFILYLPKDIVAGDFYWLEKVEDKIMFAACDCTGHGVPGAMVSVVCHNGLNRAVHEFEFSDPGEILDKTREIVVHEFEKSEEAVKDGMDISLCVINENKTKLKWAGANNPLWLLRNGILTEWKADKQPIGKYTDPKPFSSYEIEIKKGDMLYLFTDGYADQFGGEKGKKFKYANLQKLITEISSLSVREQKERLFSEFSEWKGGLEQVDDICIIGIRI